jgi:hypothetical protein
LDDPFLHEQLAAKAKNDRIISVGLLMRAQIAENQHDWIAAENYYQQAALEVANYSNLDAYGVFLKRRMLLTKAIPVLESKFHIPLRPLSFTDSITTMHQITVAYAWPMSIPDSYFYYDSIVYSFKDRITNMQNPALTAHLVEIMEQMADYYDQKTHKGDTINSRYYTLAKEALDLRKADSTDRFDSLGVQVDISEAAYNIALTYQEISKNRDSARAYYLKAVDLIRTKLLRQPSSVNLETLWERLGDFADSEIFTEFEIGLKVNYTLSNLLSSDRLPDSIKKKIRYYIAHPDQDEDDK